MANQPIRRQRLNNNGVSRSRSRIIPSKLGRASAKKSSIGRRVAFAMLGLLALVVLVMGLFGVGLAATYSGVAAKLEPRLTQIKDYKPFQASRIYDRNGTLLYEFVGAGRRTPVQLADVAPNLIKATIAVEDASFYENSGVSYLSIIRAGVAQFTKQNVGVGGASTITQQVVRNIVLTKDERENENVYSRKLKEIILARELTDQYSKNEILELYLNEIPYGNLSYGIQAASRGFFNVDAKDLTLAQSTILAGLPQLPTLYNPIQYINENNVLPGIRLPKNAWLDPTYDFSDVRNVKQVSPTKFRQIDVLRQMVKVGDLSESKARAVAAEDLQFEQPKVSLLAPHFVFFVREYLEKTYGSEVVGNGGLTITTTLDLNLQSIAQTEAYTRIQELKREERNINNAAVVIMQPNTGQILSMVGSIGYDLSETTTTPGEEGNVLDGKVNVTTALRQPGSALKPFTYMSGFEQYLETKGESGFTPATVIWDVPTIFNPRGVKYEPENFDKKAHGPLRPRTAVANSLNIPAVKALKAAGIPPTLDLLHRLGIAPTSLANDPGYYGLALTLGGGEVTPLDLATAYNTLASGGRYFAPTPILKITDANGDVLEEYKPTPLADINGDVSDTSKCEVPTIEDYQLGKRVPNGTQCVDGRLAFIITNMISDNEARRPIFGSNSILKLSQPAAVKTGTTNDFRDAWASGFTPFMTVTVWTGNNNNEKTDNVESTQGGGVIWNRVMESVFARPDLMQSLAQPYGSFEAMPQAFAKTYPGVFRDNICEIPGPFGGRTDELFVEGMSSRGKCDLYEKISVVRLSTRVGDNPNSPTTTTYCRPVAGGSYPADSLVTLFVWNLPKSDLDEKIDLEKWKGFTGDEKLGTDVAQIDPDKLPMCDKVVAPSTPTPATTPTPELNAQPTQPPPPPVQPGQIIMPSLRGLGENQARQMLYALGVRPDQVIVDYQGRDRIGGDFDLFPAFAVLSSQPAPGSVISANTTIILGVRAPDSAPPPAPTDVPPPAPTDVPPPPPTDVPPPPPAPTDVPIVTP